MGYITMRTNFFRKNPFYKEIIYSATHFLLSIFRKKKHPPSMMDAFLETLLPFTGFRVPYRRVAVCGV